MSTAPLSNRDRFDDLLIQQAVYGLNAAELNEMDELANEFEFSEDDRFDTTVAALDVGFRKAASQRLPDSLKSQIMMDAASVLQSGGTGSSAHAPIPAPVQSAGWSRRELFLTMVTAASLLFALASISGLLSGPQKGRDVVEVLPAERTPVQLRNAFLANAPSDLTRVSWTNPTNDEASLNASGDIVWSDELQEGYMRIKDLEVNDPAIKQYQLWIFDRTRNDDRPVDGGVFDIVVTDNGEIIIPIDAKLDIRDSKAFAITIEDPGGVVVSDRERLPLLAGTL